MPRARKKNHSSVSLVDPVLWSFSLKVHLFITNDFRKDLVMAKGGKKVTSKRVAKKASKVLRDKRTGSKSKSAAGSALSQREKPSKRKK